MADKNRTNIAKAIIDSLTDTENENEIDDEIKRCYIHTDNVLMSNEGTFIKTKYDWYRVAQFSFIIRQYKKKRMFKGKDEALNEILETMPADDDSIYVEKLGWNNDAHAYFFSNVAIKDGEVLKPDEFGLVKSGDKSFFMPYVESITIAQSNLGSIT